MKYKLIGTQGADPIKTILANRSIDNLEEMLNPNYIVSHFSQLNNIDLAVEKFIEHAKNKSKILVIADSDVDGFTSTALICSYMDDIKVEYSVYMHDGKQHGLTPSALEHIDITQPNLIIIPDASSSEIVSHETLLNKGIDIIILDHHEAIGESPAIIVNNQTSPNFINKDLSGVGIVHKFCQAIDSKFNAVGYCDKYLDLVAIGNIGDVMSLRNLETRTLCRRGLSNIQNPFLKTLFEKEDVTEPTVLDVGFKVAPLMNAIIRVGTMEEKVMLLDALAGKNYTVPYKPRGKEPIEQSLHDAVIRVGNNAKSRQRNATKKAMTYISKQISSNNLDNNKILIIDITDEVNKSITGLACMKVASEYKRPTMLVHKLSNGLCAGSARSYGVSNLKDICTESGLFTLCAGHQESYGVEFDPSNLDNIIEHFNDMFKDVEYSLSYDVDYIFEAKNLTKQTIETIGDFKHLWGNGIDEPMFVVKNIRINSKDVRKLGINMVSFAKNNLYYVKNFATSNFIDELTCRNEIGFGDANLVIDVVCKFKKDKYGSRVEIVDYSSKVDREIIF